jgi:hypothetical protein
MHASRTAFGQRRAIRLRAWQSGLPDVPTCGTMSVWAAENRRNCAAFLLYCRGLSTRGDRYGVYIVLYTASGMLEDTGEQWCHAGRSPLRAGEDCRQDTHNAGRRALYRPGIFGGVGRTLAGQRCA